MSTEIATLSSLSYEDAARLSGQNSYDGDTKSSLPWLTINTDGEDDSGNQVPVGAFTLELPTIGKVYSKQAIMRPFIRGYQYRLYDAEKNATTSKTKIIFQWSEEAFDTTGTVKCGKTKVKKNEFKTAEQEAYDKTVRCYMIFFGQLSLKDAVNAKGEPVTVDRVPFGWRIRGLNYLAMGDIIDTLSAKKRAMFNTEVSLTLKKDKKGANVFYVAVPKIDFTSATVPLNETDMEVFANFKAYIDAINASIFEEYKKNVKNAVANNEASVIMGEVVGKQAPLANDFVDDPLPETMGGSAKAKRNTTMAG